MTKLLSAHLTAVRDSLTEECVSALYNYRINCAKTSPAGQLILPESLKLMPLFVLGALKSIALRPNSADAGRGGSFPDPRADERATHMYLVQTLPPWLLYRLTQPRLFDVLALRSQRDGRACTLVDGSQIHHALPKPISTSSEHLQSNKVFLLDAGAACYLWVGKDTAPDIVSDIFGVDQVDPAQPPPLSDAELGSKIQLMLREIRHGLPFYAPLKVVISGSRGFDELRFLSYLIEDKTKHEMSYVDYLCAVHRKIQIKMSC